MLRAICIYIRVGSMVCSSVRLDEPFNHSRPSNQRWLGWLDRAFWLDGKKAGMYSYIFRLTNLTERPHLTTRRPYKTGSVR